MATVQLSDIIDVTVFQDLPAVNGPEKTAFYESGVVMRSGLLDSIATQPGFVAELPFWKDLAATDAPNLSSDNPASSATPKNVTQGKQQSRKAMLNQGWSASDLASELAMGPKAMNHIRNRIDTYWTRQWQRRLIATANGVLADNVANGGDMVINVAANTATSASVFTRANFTSAAFTLGDAYDTLGAIAVHSVVYKRMVDNDDIDFIPDSQGNLTIPTYLGKRVIIDDSMPVDLNGSGDTKYTSILFGAGAFGYGNGVPTTPVEIARDAAAGDGGGIETIWTRKSWILHPFGYQCKTSGSGSTAVPAGDSFSIAELALAATWDRVVERKNVPIAFLITN